MGVSTSLALGVYFYIANLFFLVSLIVMCLGATNIAMFQQLYNSSVNAYYSEVWAIYLWVAMYGFGWIWRAMWDVKRYFSMGWETDANPVNTFFAGTCLYLATAAAYCFNTLASNWAAFGLSLGAVIVGALPYFGNVAAPWVMEDEVMDGTTSIPLLDSNAESLGTKTAEMNANWNVPENSGGSAFFNWANQKLNGWPLDRRSFVYSFAYVGIFYFFTMQMAASYGYLLYANDGVVMPTPSLDSPTQLPESGIPANIVYSSFILLLVSGIVSLIFNVVTINYSGLAATLIFTLGIGLRFVGLWATAVTVSVLAGAFMVALFVGRWMCGAPVEGSLLV